MKHQVAETIELLAWLAIGVTMGLAMVPFADQIPGYEWGDTTSTGVVIALVIAIVLSAGIFLLALAYYERLPKWARYVLGGTGVVLMLYGWSKLAILGVLLLAGRPAQPNIFAVALLATGVLLLIWVHVKKVQRWLTTRMFNIIMLCMVGALSAMIATKLTALTAVALLAAIAIYDAIAVWKAGTMQKMALAMLAVGVPVGILVPKKKPYKVGKQTVDVALLGYGDVFIMVSVGGALMAGFGMLPVIGMFLAVVWLFVYSKPGKFYPAIPYIAVGCFAGMAIAKIFGG